MDILRNKKGEMDFPCGKNISPLVTSFFFSAILVPLSGEDLEDLLAKRRIARKDKTAGFCPKCGKPVLQSDVFCPFCGSTLK